MALTLQEAIDKAKNYLATVLPEVPASSVQLEELETPPFGSKWRFTFSASLPVTSNAISLADALRARRISKSVEIDPESGDLLAIKNIAA